jgi:hypothetical protein
VFVKGLTVWGSAPASNTLLLLSCLCYSQKFEARHNLQPPHHYHQVLSIGNRYKQFAVCALCHRIVPVWLRMSLLALNVLSTLRILGVQIGAVEGTLWGVNKGLSTPATLIVRFGRHSRICTYCCWLLASFVKIGARKAVLSYRRKLCTVLRWRV